MRWLWIACASALLTTTAAAEESPALRRVVVDGIELHYIEQGQGEPVILLHGGQGDYRSWAPHVAALSAHYRVISYSRRYHHPNVNPLDEHYSALVDAEDLAGFITQLRLGPTNLVGTSYGAFGALVLAMRHPELARRLVLAEPPILGWAAKSARGAPLYRDFFARTHERARPFFASGDVTSGVRVFIDAFDGDGTFDALPSERRAAILQNARFFEALTGSRGPYPYLSKAAVGRLRTPTLVVRGALTQPMNVFVSDELVRVKRAPLVIIPDAGHGSPRQNPAAFIAAVEEFLSTPVPH